MRSLLLCSVSLLLLLTINPPKVDAFQNLQLRRPTLSKTVPLLSSLPSNSDNLKEEAAAKEGTFLQTFDRFGLALKPKASQASAKSLVTEGKGRKFLYSAQSGVLYTLFILYRAYRGFFVILPAVFRQVFANLKNVVEDPFGVEGDNSQSIAKDNNHKSTPEVLGMRIKVTVGVLAAVLTITYVVTGGIRVLAKFLKGLGTSDGPFAAAAEEQEVNEALMTNHFPNHRTDNKINGDS